VVGSFVDASDLARRTPLKRAGINARQLYCTGYDRGTPSSGCAKAAFEGDCVATPIIFDRSRPGVATVLDNFAKYVGGYTPATFLIWAFTAPISPLT
jgi:hypothetical protein